MKTMKCDMAGAATVLGAMQAIARLQAAGQRRSACAAWSRTCSAAIRTSWATCCTPAAARRSKCSTPTPKAGWCWPTCSTWRCSMSPAKIIDLATLTGACVVALGNDVAGLMTNDQPWCDAVQVGRRRVRRAALAAADVRRIRRADPQRSGRHQERRRRPLGRRDHRRQVPGGIRRRQALGPPRHRRPRLPGIEPNPGSTPAAAASACGRWWKWRGSGRSTVANVRFRPFAKATTFM